MADDDDLPDDDRHPSEPPFHGGGGGARERFKNRLESVIPEILKRAVEIGVEKARESPDNLKQFASDMKLPKEIAHYLLQQIDETKNGLFRVVAKEMRDFLENTNMAGELQKLLTTVQFEVNTTIRFTPNDGGGGGGKKEGEADEKAPPESGASSSKSDRPPSDGDDDGSPGSERSERDARDGPTRLPKPEVRTQVHVRDARDGRLRPRPKRA